MQGVDLALHLLGHRPDRRTSPGCGPPGRCCWTRSNDVRGMATRLRDVVGERSLGQALREYLDFTAPAGLEVRLTEEGDAARPLPPHVKEESYLIVREAIRNALVHGAGATRLDVAVVVGRRAACGPPSPTTARASTRPPSTPPAPSGWPRMRERAEGLGGSVRAAGRAGRRPDGAHRAADPAAA